MRVQLVMDASRRLLPDDQRSEEAMARLQPGDRVAGDLKKPRNIGFHRMGFGLLHDIFDNQDRFTEFEHFRKWITCEAGFYQQIEVSGGVGGNTNVVIFVPESLAFDRMDQTRFEEVYRGIKDVAVGQLGLDWVASY